MKDPIKIIHKIKNNNKKIIYKIYIFIGSLVPNNVMKVLDKITNLDFYTTLFVLDKNEYILLENLYGHKWYEFFFISSHLEAQRKLIAMTITQKQFIETNYGKDWYNKHISNPVLVKANYSFATQYYNYLINNNKINYIKPKTLTYKTYQTGGFNDTYETLESQSYQIISYTNNENNNLKENVRYLQYKSIIPNAEDDTLDDGNIDYDDNVEIMNEEELDIDMIDIAKLEKEYSNENIENNKALLNTRKLLNQALNEDIPDISNVGIKYDENDENIGYDILLSDTYQKYYITDQYIFKDDTIKCMKNKIAVSINLSNKFDSSLKIIPEVQYLWSEYKINEDNNKQSNDQIMIGQKWIKKNELIDIDIVPNTNIIIYEKLRYNLKFIKDSYDIKLRRDDDELNLINFYNEYITLNEIYLIDIYNELGPNYNPSVEDKLNLYDVYINIYFYFITLEHLNTIIDLLNKNNTKELEYNENIFNNLLNDIKLDTEIENIIEINKIKLEQNKEFNKNFYENYIIHCNIHLNINNPKNITGTGVPNKFNLNRIFDNFIVNDDYPFIHIQTLKTEAIRKFYTEFTDKLLLSKWFETTPNGLAFKIKLKEEKYLTVIFHDTGKIEYTIIFKEEDKATFDDIEDTYVFINNLIKKINEENKKINIILPAMDQFNYGFLNSIQKFSLPNNIKINHNDLSDFSRVFYNYFALVIDPKKRESKKLIKNELSKYGTYLRYKRVNKYDNKIKMYMKILYYIKNFDFNKKDLISLIAKQFNIIEETAATELEYVKEKYYKILGKTQKKKKKIINAKI